MNCPTCKTHIDEHEASPCLNQWIATDVMGWKKTERRPAAQLNWTAYPQEWYLTPSGHLINVTNILDFGGSIAAAWEVERKIEELRLKTKYVQALLSGMLFMDVEVNNDEDMWWLLAHASPLDRCRAAIKATLLDKHVDTM